MEGIVKAWYPNGGFGFILPLIGNPDEVHEVFVHKTGLWKGHGLPVGARVYFDLAESDFKHHGCAFGIQAINVRIKNQHIDPSVLFKNPLAKRESPEAPA